MSLLTVSSLAKSYDPVDIFAGVTFDLPHQARYAIVGPNGVGKTTLLRILAGLEKPSGGNYHLARGVSIGYLPQEAKFESKRTLWEESLKAFSDIRSKETELVRLEKSMSDGSQSENDLENVLTRYGKLQAVFEREGGYTYETRIKQVLMGLGFTSKDYKRPIHHLSGGQRTRAFLARLLLSRHDLLLLDEPTNHLDINAVEWLENFLKDWDGAVLFVSHDRYFIDKISTHILEMFRGSVETYRGNYTAYLNQRKARWSQREEFYTSEKARLESELEYIKRNIAGQNVNQARGKLRRLSRYLEAVEQIGFEGVRGRKWIQIAEEVDYGHPMGVAEAESRIKALTPPFSHHQQLKIRLIPKRRSGKIVLRTKKLCIGYPENHLFDSEDIELHRLECVSIIGPNGSGKSSFLKTIIGQIPPARGTISLGASLDIAYFAQAHEDLNVDNTIIDEINSIAPYMLPGEIRNYLARFLFTGEDVFKPIRVLSGGERGRLALAKLALSDANLLLLDEPTNHLDIPAQEILQDVLANYEGTAILVSHDRYLVESLATQIWEIDPEDKTLKVYKGKYSDYRSQTTMAGNSDSGELIEEDNQRETWRRTSRAKNLALSEERRRIQRLEEIETLITILEGQLEAIGERLENPPPEPEKTRKLGEEYVHIQDRLEQLIREWEQLNRG